MLKDIRDYDNPTPAKEARAPVCMWGWACAHKNCPVYLLEQVDGRDMEAEGLIGTNFHGDVCRCSLIRIKGCAVWSFLSKMGLAASVVLIPCTIFQTPWWATVLLGCSGMIFFSLWRWLVWRR